MVDEAVGDVGLAGDVRDPAGVEPLAGEDADRGVEDLAPAVDRRGLGARPSGPHLAPAAIGAGPAVGERRQRGADLVLARRGRARRQTKPSPSSASASTSPQGSTIIEWPAGVVVRRRLRRPGRRRARTTWFSIARARSRTSQWSRPVGRGERGRDRDHAGAADREDPVELREAEVVADAEPEPEAAGVGADDLVAGLLAIGLAVADAADVDVEHVELAVGGDDLAGGDRSGSEVLNRRLRRPRPARRCCRRPGGSPCSRAHSPAAARVGLDVERLGARRRDRPREPSRFHFSGSTTSSAPRGGRLGDEPPATSRLRALSAVELSWIAAARID